MSKQDVILAGVGGQGILTVAEAISRAAVRRGLEVKQAEVHGMSQRGGAVQSHLRLSDEPIWSDLIALGQCDLVIAVEPLEALRHVHTLADGGALVTSTNAFVNIGAYPPVEGLLARIARHPRHVVIDADRVARAAGSGRSANIAMLGAASLFLTLDPAELEEAVAEMFAAKGEAVAATNRRAFRFGRNVAQAYLDGLERGGTPAAVRQWVEKLSPDQLALPERPDAPVFAPMPLEDRLSGAEQGAVENLLLSVYEEGRRQLFEHEVYQIVQLIGAIQPPQHVFLRPDELISAEVLSRFPGESVVLKIVSPDVVHKTEAHGIAFVPRELETVRREIDRLIERHRANADVRGVLVVEFLERKEPGFGNELFVGIRGTREFGPVIAAGLGGVDTEYLATKMKPGLAVAKAAAFETTPEQFLELFRATVAYEILSGKARGHRRIASDGELLRCFRAFLYLARHFCTDRGQEGPDVFELEVNPFAFRQQRLVPLDGRGRLAPAPKAKAARPIATLDRLLEPRSIAVLGVSGSNVNFGRIILRNILAAGFPPERLRVVKENEASVDGVPCVPTMASLPETVDLLVMAVSGAQLPALVDEAVQSGKVRSSILIPGGVGETEGTARIAAAVGEAIARGRALPDGGPVFLGPNSLGVISRPGRYDTMFIPENRLDKRYSAPARRVALASQSGAFIVTRISNLQTLDPAFAISIGNQLDLTVSDLVAALARRADLDAIGVYVEGFTDLDGLAAVRAIRQAVASGKEVVFYKAGRTEPGRSAAAGHTASVAGDYDVCLAAAEQAGAIVVETFKEFEQLLVLTTALHGKSVGGLRLGAVSNAGFETVGIADAIAGPRYRVEIAKLGPESTANLVEVLEDRSLAKLVNARNPLDLTPMADERAYAGAIRALAAAPEVDALVVGIVPLTAALRTIPGEMEKPGSLTTVLPALFRELPKPMVVVVDAGPDYEPFCGALRAAGVPVFPSADQAVRSLGRYLSHRSERQPASAVQMEAVLATA